MSRLARPSWVEIDLGVIAHNLKLTRELIGDDVKLYAVCKADALGCGLLPVARTLEAHGADAIAVSDPADVVELREAGIRLPILLFASTLPEQAADVAELDVIPAVHDMPSLDAFAGVGRTIEVFFKIDAGLGRLGFAEHQWQEAFEAARRKPNLRIKGLYTHLSKPEDRTITAEQAARFERACGAAHTAGFRDFERMAASSRVVLGYPELHYTAVDPGSLLLGLVGPPWAGMAPTRPAIRALKSRIIQVQQHPAGATLGIGYGKPIASERAMRTAVIPIGFADGLNHVPPLGEVLVCGRRAPVLGRRSNDFSLLDVTGIQGAEVGSEAVLLGRQGEAEISATELAESLGHPMIELLPRIARSTRRIYLS